MSEDNQTNADKNQNKNNLEKIIKLDKKNGNFDIYDKYSKRKLKIRTSQNSSYINNTYQNEYILCYFWRHINQVYFRKIDEPETERLEYINSVNQDPIVTDFPLKYTDPKYFEACQQILNKQYIKSENKAYWDNLLKHIRITGLIQKNKLQLPKQKIMQKYKCKTQNNGGIIQENQQLDRFMNKLDEQINDDSGNNDDIYKQILESSKELQQINKSNKKELSILQSKINSELPLNIFGTQVHIYKQGRNNHGLTKSEIIYNNDALLTYLRTSLKQLDFKQTAESIAKVTNSNHVSTGQQYTVYFESALNPNPVNIDENLIQELDKLRDQSLFRFYNIPQKTKLSHIASNFIGIHHVYHNRQKSNQLINKNLFKDVKTAPSQDGESLSKFEACHHCKLIFKEEYLVSCNYKSGTMGLPLINNSITDSYLFAQMDDEGIKSRRQVPNRKKTAYSIYSKKNGELICQRKFCRMCLKQNYDFKLEDIVNKSDWVCPFCQAICFCSRCQRNDIMIKLKDLYTICGGDLEQLTKDSIFEKYVRPLTDDQLYRRKTTQLQRTGYSQIKQQLNNFKDMQTIRLDFENLRLLCSQLIRREKMKWKLIEQDIVIWHNEIKQIQKTKQIQNHNHQQSNNNQQKNVIQNGNHSTKINQKSDKKKQEIIKKQEQQQQQQQQQKQQQDQSSVQQKQQQKKNNKKQQSKQQNKEEYYDEIISSSTSSSSSSEYYESNEYDSDNEVNNQKNNEIDEIQKKKIAKQKKSKIGTVDKILQSCKSFPLKNVKREVAYLLQNQDTDTYNLIVKKIRDKQGQKKQRR